MSARFAAHIMAHDKPQLLGALVESLHHARIDVYIHIDAGVAQPMFVDALPRGITAHFVPHHRRVRVRWGGLSQLRATFALLDQARANGGRYHRHSLLSGTDVLLRDLPELIDLWSGDDELIRVDRRIDSPDQPMAQKITTYHFPDHPLLDRLRLSGRIPRRTDITLPIFQGSQWWSLTDDAVAAARKVIDDHPKWLRRHRFSHCPDEFVIHSALMATRYREMIAQEYSALTECPDHTVHGQHFIDWSDPTALRPPELTAESLARARAGPAMFARKAGADWTWRMVPTC
ncbi:beta-1,6-N-acetylglucosaminyltransferase [Gordonia sp. Z-3]|uniref:beta-1,6-N-acetylglucosaminyltransferase n=1 Tax=Gordonia sp. Z-3 TaxID=3115408 RepID=UPI002E2D2537|nr:beta-1,6-N-acetylglucosaminyltransferase [Gordonia sp. Z-3]MED5800367.1 beta-1,6-N-acetylglucosaminyltransferase [Gordonia sp. Z-3]